MVRVAQNPKPYFTVIWDSPQPGRPGPHIYTPQEKGGPVQSQISESHYDWLSVNQYVLQSSPRGFRWAVFEWILIQY
jgi:hypothetical protein